MLGFIGRRILQSVPTLFLISALLFFGMQMVPGGPEQAFAFRSGMSEAARQSVIHQWGLDQPLHIQYLKWLQSMFTGNWQFSFFMHRSVREVIFQRLPATLILMVTAYLIAQIIAFPAGILAEVPRSCFFVLVLTIISLLDACTPPFST